MIVYSKLGPRSSFGISPFFNFNREVFWWQFNKHFKILQNYRKNFHFYRKSVLIKIIIRTNAKYVIFIGLDPEDVLKQTKKKFSTRFNIFFVYNCTLIVEEWLVVGNSHVSYPSKKNFLTILFHFYFFEFVYFWTATKVFLYKFTPHPPPLLYIQVALKYVNLLINIGT